MATHFLADPHFFHASMLTFAATASTRPYPDVESMNDAMASAWRKRVKTSDDIIVLGDFAHRAEPKALQKLFDSLPGRKHLIVGNHDGPQTLALGWESTRDIALVSIDSQRVCLCHYPMLSWNGSRRGVIQLYGHHHGKIPGNQQSADIGVDVMGIAPVRLNQIRSYMATLPPRMDPEGGDDFENDGVQL